MTGQGPAPESALAATPPIPATTPAPPALAALPTPLKKTAHFYAIKGHPIRVVLATVGGARENAESVRNTYRALGYVLHNGMAVKAPPE